MFNILICLLGKLDVMINIYVSLARSTVACLGTGSQSHRHLRFIPACRFVERITSRDLNARNEKTWGSSVHSHLEVKDCISAKDVFRKCKRATFFLLFPYFKFNAHLLINNFYEMKIKMTIPSVLNIVYFNFMPKIFPRTHDFSPHPVAIASNRFKCT